MTAKLRHHPGVPAGRIVQLPGSDVEIAVPSAAFPDEAGGDGRVQEMTLDLCPDDLLGSTAQVWIVGNVAEGPDLLGLAPLGVSSGCPFPRLGQHFRESMGPAQQRSSHLGKHIRLEGRGLGAEGTAADATYSGSVLRRTPFPMARAI